MSDEMPPRSCSSLRDGRFGQRTGLRAQEQFSCLRRRRESVLSSKIIGLVPETMEIKWAVLGRCHTFGMVTARGTLAFILPVF